MTEMYLRVITAARRDVQLRSLPINDVHQTFSVMHGTEYVFLLVAILTSVLSVPCAPHATTVLSYPHPIVFLLRLSSLFRYSQPISEAT
ncbi:hypothetical protein CY34DRAFT_801580 [Suillus luteus UH-Slu-Lm8-n1]|uniref:Unplaced genomic scaffold CY34scaffold_41, whole genome shotgun sequence n=1 Tax=Suillus luteus UH-Slu-Lm8-n1 TaxID=930992 RepID=A0A0D0A5Y3_9AGAM|nr:hypothetical protein CY34DRAFT_801580 [Suillus luteus UH-Slu-Lm8-n1]